MFSLSLTVCYDQFVILIVQDIREHADTAEILEDFSSQAREKVNKLRGKIDVSNRSFSAV